MSKTAYRDGDLYYLSTPFMGFSTLQIDGIQVRSGNGLPLYETTPGSPYAILKRIGYHLKPKQEDCPAFLFPNENFEDEKDACSRGYHVKCNTLTFDEIRFIANKLNVNVIQGNNEFYLRQYSHNFIKKLRRLIYV